MVERTATAYGTTLSNFCCHALDMSRQDTASMWFENPTPEVLARLSDGTGFSIEKLEDMAGANLHRRIARACEELLSTEEGRAAAAAFKAGRERIQSG